MDVIVGFVYLGIAFIALIVGIYWLLNIKNIINGSSKRNKSVVNSSPARRVGFRLGTAFGCMAIATAFAIVNIL